MAKFVADGEVRAAIASGGRIEKVVVIALRDAHGRAEFVPHLGTSWRRGYMAIGLWSGQGARSWRDLTRLVSFFRDEMRFRGLISVYEADDPALQKYRTLLPGSAPALPGNKPPKASRDPDQDPGASDLL